MNQTLNNSQERELECPYCQEKIDNFESHINGGLENQITSSCGNCDLALKNEKCLISHVKIAHLNAMKVFSCEICNIDFDSKKYLFLHKDLIHDQKEIKKEDNSVFIDMGLNMSDQDKELYNVEIKLEAEDVDAKETRSLEDLPLKKAVK